MNVVVRELSLAGRYLPLVRILDTLDVGPTLLNTSSTSTSSSSEGEANQSSSSSSSPSSSPSPTDHHHNGFSLLSWAHVRRQLRVVRTHRSASFHAQLAQIKLPTGMTLILILILVLNIFELFFDPVAIITILELSSSKRFVIFSFYFYRRRSTSDDDDVDDWSSAHGSFAATSTRFGRPGRHGVVVIIIAITIHFICSSSRQ